MQFAKALAKAVKFAASGKAAPDVLKQVRVYGDDMSWVHATDGEMGVLIAVDRPHIETIMSLDQAKLLAKEPILESKKSGQDIVFKLPGDRRITCTLGGAQNFPPIPEYPKSYQEMDGFGRIQDLVHAALKRGGTIDDTERPDLECVHLCPDRVEASDTARVAILEFEFCISGKVPARFFRYWGRGPVLVGTTATHLWARIGDDELRYSCFQPGTFASGRNLRELVPEVVHDSWLVVDLDTIRHTVKRATDAAPTNSIFLELSDEQIHIKAGSGETTFFGAVDVWTSHWAEDDASIIVDGKYLGEALKSLKTPNVRLCYPKGGGHLRVESGPYLETIYHKTG